LGIRSGLRLGESWWCSISAIDRTSNARRRCSHSRSSPEAGSAR